MRLPHTTKLFSISIICILAMTLAPLPDMGPIFGHGDTAYAQIRAQRAPTRVIVKIPKLEIEVPSLNPDNAAFGKELVVYKTQTINLRWGMPISSGAANWDIADAPFPDGTVLKSGSVFSEPAADKWHYFTIDLAGVLPVNAPPASQPKKYYIRLVPLGDNKAIPSTVTLLHREEPEMTRFTAAGLYPELFRPMPIFVNLHTFRLRKADEEDDEEPFIVPVVIYFDGTTVKALDIQDWSVRLQTSERGNVHGNIPRYNGQMGSGDEASIPKDVGYFEQDILPVSLDLADDQLFSEMFGFNIDYTHLTRATTVFVLLLALEEDATSDQSANAARDAIIQGFQDELNKCIQSLELADVINLINTGSNLDAILTEDDADLCGYTATADSTVLDQIRAKLKDLAKDAAIGEELDEAKNWLPGGGLFLLNQVENPDDVIGFRYRSFSYAQIMNASGPISFTFDIDQVKEPSFPSAGAKITRYSIDGSIGRCVHVRNRSRCVPQHKPLLDR